MSSYCSRQVTSSPVSDMISKNNSVVASQFVCSSRLAILMPNCLQIRASGGMDRSLGKDCFNMKSGQQAKNLSTEKPIQNKSYLDACMSLIQQRKQIQTDNRSDMPLGLTSRRQKRGKQLKEQGALLTDRNIVDMSERRNTQGPSSSRNNNQNMSQKINKRTGNNQMELFHPLAPSVTSNVVNHRYRRYLTLQNSDFQSLKSSPKEIDGRQHSFQVGIGNGNQRNHNSNNSNYNNYQVRQSHQIIKPQQSYPTTQSRQSSTSSTTKKYQKISSIQYSKGHSHLLGQSSLHGNRMQRNAGILNAGYDYDEWYDEGNRRNNVSQSDIQEQMGGVVRTNQGLGRQLYGNNSNGKATGKATGKNEEGVKGYQWSEGNKKIIEQTKYYNSPNRPIRSGRTQMAHSKDALIRRQPISTPNNPSSYFKSSTAKNEIKRYGHENTSQQLLISQQPIAAPMFNKLIPFQWLYGYWSNSEQNQ